MTGESKSDPLIDKKKMAIARRDQEEVRERYSYMDQPLKFGILLRVFRYTRKYPRLRKGLYLLVVLRAIQLPVLTWGIGRIISGPIEGENMNLLVWSVVIFLGWALFLDVTHILRSRIGQELDENMVFDLRNELFAHLMRQTMGFYNKTKVGRIISRMTSDIETLRQGVQTVFFASIVQFGQMVGAAVLMVITNWTLFLIMLVLGPLLWVMDRFFRRRISQASRITQESFSRVTAAIAESIKGIRVTQAFTREKVNSEIFDGLVREHAQNNVSLVKHTSLFMPLLELNTQLSMGLILIVGGWGVLHPEIAWSVGGLITFFFLANLFFNPLKTIGRHFTIALAAMAGAERVFRLLDSRPEWEDAADAKTLPKIGGKVCFEDVRFSYDGKTEVLHGINFSVEPGSSVALVGHTGSGKSTIINLLGKFFPPTGGRVTVDGEDLMGVKSQPYRSQLGIVLQKNFIFSGTVMENIRLGRPGASDEEVYQTVEKLGCRDLIDSMPNGFMTPVAENGVGLSQGQQQIVCFARALIANPRILMLDEATSSVDILTETRLQQALERLIEGRTTFIVAHRLSTIRKADQVLVLDHGKIIERGDHESLLRKAGAYCRLYRQFAA